MTDLAEFKYIDLLKLGAEVNREGLRMWPWLDTSVGLSMLLCEETGEVSRALTKRNDTIRSGGPVKGKNTADWTDNLSTELAQVVCVVARLAYIEDIDLVEAIQKQLSVLKAKKSLT